MTRGGKRSDEVTVVRTGPDLRRLHPGEADPELRRGRRFLVAYIGVMGPQDGVDIVVRAANIVVNKLGRDDIAFTLIGSGDCFDDLVALRDELGLAGHAVLLHRRSASPEPMRVKAMSHSHLATMSAARATMSTPSCGPVDVSARRGTGGHVRVGLTGVQPPGPARCGRP